MHCFVDTFPKVYNPSDKFLLVEWLYFTSHIFFQFVSQVFNGICIRGLCLVPLRVCGYHGNGEEKLMVVEQLGHFK